MTQDINWDTNPTDVFANLTPDPTLNRDMLPDVLANFVFDAAERMGADPALFAIAVLTVAASAIDDGFKIQPKRYDTEWQTSARLWMIGIGSSWLYEDTGIQSGPKTAPTSRKTYCRGGRTASRAIQT